MDNGKRYKLTVNGYRLTVNGYWLTVNGYRLTVNGYWLTVNGYWLTVNGYWLLAIGYWLTAIGCQAQTFTIERKTDSLYVLTLTTDSLTNGQSVALQSTRDQWRLPYPVYRMETGDVDGNGTIEALVGVIKPTRFYPEMGRRLFIFKNYEGLVRPMWLGSKLGGTLQDFHFRNGVVRSLETNARGEYTVAEYRWGGFGPKFERYLVRNTDETTARKFFEHESNELNE